MTIKLFFDIETIPDQRPDALDRHLDQVHPPRNYKNKDTIDAWMLENAERIANEEWMKTGLSGLRGEIVSIAWAIDDGEIRNHVRTNSEAESDLLEAFWQDLHWQEHEFGGSTGKWPRIEWVGHNILEFDLRFLKQRSIITGVNPLHDIPADSRHGQGSVFDTMKEWCGFRDYVKQDDLCDALVIDAPGWATHVAATDGSKVWEMWSNEEYDLLGLYNKLDVWKVREIYRRMMYRVPHS